MLRVEVTPFAASPPGLRDEKGSRQTQSVRVDGGGIGTDRSLSTCVPSALPQPACLARCRRLIPDSLIIARRHLGSIRVALTARTTTVAADTTQCYPLRRRRPAARHNNRPTSACRTPSSRPEPVSPSVSSPVLSSSVVARGPSSLVSGSVSARDTQSASGCSTRLRFPGSRSKVPRSRRRSSSRLRSPPSRLRSRLRSDRVRLSPPRLRRPRATRRPRAS